MTSVSAILPAECQNFGVSENIVVYLILPLVDKEYTLWMDNWYSSCKLYRYLQSTLPKNSCMWYHTCQSCTSWSEKCTASNWSVVCLSQWAVTLHEIQRQKRHFYVNDPTQWISGRCPRGRGKPSTADVRQKPECINEYNCNMGAVDRQDQLLEVYSAARKSMKWYKKLSFHLLQLAMLNAHILYQKSGGKKTFLRFEHTIIADFLFPGNEPHAEKLESVIRLTERHFPSALASSATWTKPQSRCKVCSRQGWRRDVKTICDQCLSKSRLCAVPYFGLWHSKARHWDWTLTYVWLYWG